MSNSAGICLPIRLALGLGPFPNKHTLSLEWERAQAMAIGTSFPRKALWSVTADRLCYFSEKSPGGGAGGGVSVATTKEKNVPELKGQATPVDFGKTAVR